MQCSDLSLGSTQDLYWTGLDRTSPIGQDLLENGAPRNARCGQDKHRIPNGNPARRAAPQPRASPSEGRPAATAHRDRHTRPGSKLPACPPRRSAPHPRPQLGAERACDAPAVKSRLHFCPLENHLMLVNLKVAITRTSATNEIESH